MAGFAEDGSDFDTVLLAQRIQAHRLPILPITWLIGLTDGLPRDRGANLQKHAAIIREAALRRRIIAHSERVRAMADRGADAAELFAAVRDIERLAEFDSNGNLLPASFAAKAGLKLIEGAMAEDVITEWLIPNLLPKGTLVGIIGQPGIGKTTASLRMCAEVSNNSGKPILFLSNEDSPGRIASSFARLGGNKALIKLEDQDQAWMLDQVEPLRQSILDLQPAVIVIDSLFGHSPAKTDLHKHQDAARLLVPLRQLAEETGTTICLISHENKVQSNDAAVRTMGSNGIRAILRFALHAVQDAGDSSVVHLFVSKTNISRKDLPGRKFKLEPNFQWLGESDLTLEAAFQAARDSGTTGGKRTDLIDHFLREALKGGSRNANDVIRDATDRGISEKQLFSARERLGVQSHKGSKGWIWMLTQATIN